MEVDKRETEELEIVAETMDHLGLVAAVAQELKIAERIDKRLFGGDERRKVTPGTAVVAMILNGLGFVDHRLYLVASFYENKPVDKLLGENIKAEHLNDYTLGHALDEIYSYGVTNLFMEVVNEILQENNLYNKFRRIDSTSIYVEGAYDNYPDSELNITHGHSKDHRPDLKQFMVSLSVTGKAELPHFLEVHDGNTSDGKKFPTVIEKIHKFESNLMTNEDVIYIADAALYNAENVLSMKGIQWISRVPETISHCKEIVKLTNEEIEWKEIDDNYKLCEFASEYGSVKQRWILIFSKAACRKEKKTFADNLDKTTKELEKIIQHFENKEFTSIDLATEELKKISKKYKYHKIEISRKVEVNHYKTPGRHADDEKPLSIGFKFVLKYSDDKVEIQNELNTKGRFILATNVLSEDILDSKTVLEEYKNQQHTERGFRFLKDSKFMTDEVYLKNPNRIQSLMMIMTLCLLVYKYSQYKVRQALVATNDTLPNQKKHEVQNPTMKWLYQKMLGVIVMRVNPYSPREKIIMSNVNQTREKIIRLFGTHACKIYSLHPD
jgi:transposase